MSPAIGAPSSDPSPRTKYMHPFTRVVFDAVNLCDGRRHECVVPARVDAVQDDEGCEALPLGVVPEGEDRERGEKDLV
jgi:hypothetical protein